MQNEGWIKIHSVDRHYKNHYYSNSKILCGRHKSFIPLGVYWESPEENQNCKHCRKILTSHEAKQNS